MKHTKRIISLVLALTMLCAMAISVSAATYTWSGSYNGYSVEVSDSCTISKFSSTLISDSPDNLQITARVYGWEALLNSDGTYTILDAPDNLSALFTSDPSITVAGISMVDPYATIAKVQYTHTVAGDAVFIHTLTASAT